MSGENNGQSRLDRLEGLMQLLIDDHLKFSDDLKLLLRSQVFLTESQERTEKRIQELAATQKEFMKEITEAQKHTDERLNALINIVDDLIRKRPNP